MSYQAITFDVADGIGTLTLNRPDAFNALDMQMGKELLDVANRCDGDPAVRCVILTGSGDKAFCAGGDLAMMQQAGDDVARLVRELTTYLHAALSRFSRMDAPVIGAINGVAAGAGISLAAFVDLAIAAESARFMSAYSAAGLTPDGSSTYFLPRMIGLRRYLELALLNRSLSAQEALDWGIVNRVVPDADLGDEVQALARQLADGPSRAYGGIKRLAHNSFSDTLESQMELETRLIAEMVQSRDGQEGINAFVAKKTPKFTGS